MAVAVINPTPGFIMLFLAIVFALLSGQVRAPGAWGEGMVVYVLSFRNFVIPSFASLARSIDRV